MTGKQVLCDRRSRTLHLWAASLMVGLAFLATGCGVNEIVHNLEEREANEILVLLAKDDIEAQKVIEEGRVVTWKVVVPKKSAHDARKILVNYGLPKPRPNRLQDVFSESGMIPTQSEEKAKMLMGIQGEIEKKLMLIPGVVDVHAQVVIPNRETIRDVNEAKPLPMAAVVVVYNLIDAKKPYRDDDIKLAVSASVEELTPERVTVLSYLNRPMQLPKPLPIGEPEEGSAGCPACPSVAATATSKVFGILVDAKKKNVSKFKTLLAVAGGLVLVLLILLIVFVLSRIGLKRQLSKTLAENMAFKKARGGGGAAPPPAETPPPAAPPPG